MQLLIFSVFTPILIPALILCGCSSEKDTKTNIKKSSEEDFIEKYQELNIHMIWIDGGSFKMGTPLTPKQVEKHYGGRAQYFEDEHIPHEVEASGFWMGKTEVTIGQYRKFLQETGDVSGVEWSDEECPLKNESGYPLKDNAFGKNPDQPVILVSWNGANSFCEWLSEKTGKNYSLPSEKQWEYACRAGTRTMYCFGDDADDLGDFAWYSANSGGRTHAVGKKKANAWGLYDMHGNVWEWCLDWYDYYERPGNILEWLFEPFDSSGRKKKEYRVLRGGSWRYAPRGCRSASRERDRPTTTWNCHGFRIVRLPEE